MTQPPVKRRARIESSPPEVDEPILDLARRYSEVCSLLEIARSLLGTGRPAEILGRLLHTILGITGTAHAAGYLYSGSRRKLQLAVAFGITPPARSERHSLTKKDEQYFEALEGDGVVAVHPGSQNGRSALPPGSLKRWAESIRADYVFPLRARDSLLGVAVIGPRIGGEGYAPETLELLARAANLAAQALEAGAGEEQAEQLYPTLPETEAKAPSQVSRRLRDLRAQHEVLQRILGESPAMLRLLEEAVSVAPTRCPVLIQGETGCGKEVLARAVHEMSPRSRGPFEVVDCGSIPRELIESELFGHERGAFTGAVRDRRGIFELAHRGTVFLDELGELPLPAQTRLLRVLQEGSFRRVGGEESVNVDVRVVAATNRDLWSEVSDGRFRSDLFYRVSVLTLHVPPLRERKTDIPILARHFAKVAAEDLGAPPLRIDETIERRLQDHHYPGNIRELQNLVTALAVARPGEMGSVEWDRIVRRPATAGAGLLVAASPPKRGGHTMGNWVVNHLRRHGFNIAAAGRSLKEAQAKEGTLDAPVADRSTLTYYFQGECLREFCEADFNMEAAVQSLAGGPYLVGVVSRRLRATLRLLAEAAEGDGGLPAARKVCERRLPKLPAAYSGFLDRVIQSYLDRRWRLAG